MDRRDFLKLFPRASLAAVAFPSLSLETVPGQRFRGTAEGEIYESTDNGQTWQLSAKFGSNCPILDIFQEGSQVYARVGVRDQSFLVRSSGENSWRVVSQTKQNIKES